MDAAAALSARELAGVAAALTLAGHQPVGQLDAALISGGRSNLTYRITDGVRRWVLRTPPRAGRTPSAHDVAREHRVTAALRGSDVPVAEAVLLHVDEELLGGPFAVSAFVEGRALRTRDELAELGDPEVGRVVASMLGSLVALHRVDHRAVGLASFGRPDGYAARQLRRWTGQWTLTGSAEHLPLAEEVIRGLGRRVPEQLVSTVVHGDYRIDNTLVRDTDVAAVVDWELSTIGDPVSDVAMMCAYRDPAFDLITGGPSAWTSDRLPAPDRLAEMYAGAGGRELAHWDFHLALANFKIAAIAAGIDHRRRSGVGSGPGFDTAGEAVPRFLELARDALPRAVRRPPPRKRP
ncbi:phosphotransferase family protein [Phytohabitans sp. ZYX-F-186]|uniref:Phosphotransferase family protein n=1 Tax=Phytohabitans maris TaxID=3071409 RepID=A0ABU0ZFW5_9ACTN|nr:phosphotransferase family protein [Phytohabitans sp. ZYX-F-186]MDQ7905222.1 phosphotransferase family protein [Phytohabitans sp. ZYX-F-186]